MVLPPTHDYYQIESSTMALNPPGALAGSHLSSSSLNPAAVIGRGTPAIIDLYASISISSPQPAAAAAHGNDGSSSWRPPLLWPKLLLDSGANIHVVGDSRLLSNLRDAPAGMTVTVADGNTLPITEIGDIQILSPGGFRIPDVHLAPGLKSDLISVRVLTRSRICTRFDGDRATLHVGPELVGEAVAPRENLNGRYMLQFLRVPKLLKSGSNQPEALSIASHKERPAQVKRMQTPIKKNLDLLKKTQVKRKQTPIKKEVVKSKQTPIKKKLDIPKVPLDSPSMGTRSKILLPSSPAMNTRSKRKLNL